MLRKSAELRERHILPVNPRHNARKSPEMNPHVLIRIEASRLQANLSQPAHDRLLENLRHIRLRPLPHDATLRHVVSERRHFFHLSDPDQPIVLIHHLPEIDPHFKDSSIGRQSDPIAILDLAPHTRNPRLQLTAHPNHLRKLRVPIDLQRPQPIHKQKEPRQHEQAEQVKSEFVSNDHGNNDVTRRIGFRTSSTVPTREAAKTATVLRASPARYP